jgi:3-oxoacyl-[acyl-carrier protein] reductase
MNIIITGASRGIGRAIALELAHKGNNILINCARSKDALDGVSSIIMEHDCGCVTFMGDVSGHDVCRQMVDTAVAKFGSVDVLVNNAGISSVGLFQDMSADEWDRIWRVNVGAVFNCCQLVLPHMISAKSGKIINISSVWGNVGASCEVAYSATKGAVNSLTKALAKEVAPSGIQVNAVACGAIDTEMNSHLSDDDKSALADEIPAGRFGTPAEIAHIVKQLTEAPSYLTGQIITVDGGWT